MKLFLTAIVVSMLALSASGQCTLGADKAPKIGGAYLGMTMDQAMEWYGKPFKQEPNHLTYFGVVPTSTEGLDLLKAKHFDGLTYVSLDFAYSKLTAAMVHYKPIEWKSANEFAESLSGKLGLPNAWEYHNGKAYLTCSDFSLIADHQGNTVFLMDNAPMKKKFATDQKAAEDKKRDFKP